MAATIPTTVTATTTVPATTVVVSDLALPDFNSPVIQNLLANPLDKANLVAAALTCMVYIGQSATITGAQKKEWVLSALRQIIQTHSGLDDVSRAELMVLVNTLVPGAIDGFVSASQGAYVFAQKIEKQFCGSCCGDPGNTVSTPAKN